MIRAAIRGSRKQLKPSDQPMPCSSAQVQAYQPPLATTSQVKSASLVIIRECCSTASRKKIQMMANFSVGENLLWGYYLQNVA